MNQLFFLLNRKPAIPTKPVPKRSKVPGSGTGVVPSVQRLKWDKPFLVQSVIFHAIS